MLFNFVVLYNTEGEWKNKKELRGVFARRKRCEGVGEIGEGIEEHKPPVV